MGQPSKMGSPHINTFCCCLGLESGTKLVGYLHLISATVLLILTSYWATEARHQIGTSDDMDGTYGTAYKGLCFVAVLGSFHVVLAAVLLYGAYKRKTVLLRLWVFVMLFLYVSAIVFVIVVTAVHGPSESGSDLFLAFVKGGVFFGFVGYSVLCVNSFYLLLRSDQDMCGPSD